MTTLDLDYAKSIIEQDGGFRMIYKAEHNAVALAHAKNGQTVGRYYLNFPEDGRRLLLALQTMERRIAKRSGKSAAMDQGAHPTAATYR